MSETVDDAKLEQPLVSVVVTTRNEEKHISNCLLSIKEQTYGNIEAIVVDNASTDKTKEISRQYTPHVYDKGPERSAQRNYGMIDIAQGEYVMFVDADMILSPCLIENCLRFLLESDCVALHITEVILGVGYWSEVRRFERSFYDGTVIDGARFFRKDSFVAVHGFDESLIGADDWDIDKKIKAIGPICLLAERNNSQQINGWKLGGIIRDNGVDPCHYGCVIFHDEARFDLKKYLVKKKYYSGSFNNYIGKWGSNDSDIKRQLGLFYRFITVFCEKGKWKRFIGKPYMVCGLYFLRVMVGIAFLRREK